ncbi:hypothetical protein IX39_06130 [Chryseobacterium formosense]|uniref:DUF6922 domain-containing protein n=1 Tax=Chryseobacterium formosense TaxID=236814 RepID=A0A085ZAG2_9FLAO|nr:hypothetical protein [Chryseobacterium formosense]KFF01426.1 hypothetical protein IX39_06130 [Chryseobacterium formosense]SFT63468.1 hypothetical protein SAMN05421857_2312 [Chryseobacterium formosense]
MNSEITIKDFSQHLFWDVDLAIFDLENYKEFMVGRVVEYGKLKDWELLKSLYGKQKIKDISLNLRSLDAVSLSFLSTIFNIDKSEFRCYKHRQLVQNYWNS